MFFIDENHKLGKLMSQQRKSTEDLRDENKITIFKAKQERQQASNTSE